MPHTSNVFLATLAPADIGSLRPHLKTFDRPQGAVLFEVGAAIQQVYFPHSGIVSLVVELASDGGQIRHMTKIWNADWSLRQ